MTIWYLIAALLLLVSGVFILLRLAIGPSTLDRAVALDMMTAILMGFLLILSASTHRQDPLVVVLMLSLVGFISSTSLARFVAPKEVTKSAPLSRAAVEQQTRYREELAARWEKLEASRAMRAARGTPGADTSPHAHDDEATEESQDAQDRGVPLHPQHAGGPHE
ncbi:MAG: monovalent cation/H+ antiporter complex subunit F [Actinomycetaceae bacterium]|nr:monovalent cation/H+ antiporter complex subunit F [Actinomycetaceae bacterium]